MGFYLWGYFPVGPVLVGLLAGSGFGIASWITGYRIRSAMLVVVAALQLIAYTTAQYIDFKIAGPLVDPATGGQMGFVSYIQHPAVSMMHENWSGRSPLGTYGYVVKVAEAVGFVVGALAVPLALIRHPYCELCLAYMRRRKLAEIRASPPFREIGRRDIEKQQDYAKEQQAALAAAMATLAEIQGSAQRGDCARFKALLPPAWKDAGHLQCRIRLYLARCRQCRQGRLQAMLVTGDESREREEPLSETVLSAEFVEDFEAR
jgi:hypothetical protein